MFTTLRAVFGNTDEFNAEITELMHPGGEALDLAIDSGVSYHNQKALCLQAPFKGVYGKRDGGELVERYTRDSNAWPSGTLELMRVVLVRIFDRKKNSAAQFDGVFMEYKSKPSVFFKNKDSDFGVVMHVDLDKIIDAFGCMILGVFPWPRGRLIQTK